MTRSAPRSPSHRSVPIRGRIVKSAYDARSRPSSSGVRWLTQSVRVGSSAATTSVTSRLHLAEVGAVAERQVDRDALEPGRAGPLAQHLRRRPRARGRCRPWRCMLVSSSSTNRASGWRSSSAATSSTRLTVWMTAVGERVVDLERGAERPPRGEHEQVAVEAGRDLGQLGVGADREGVDAAATSPAFAGQPAEAEAVAVALGDRHQAGGRLGDAAQVAAPAVAVDGQGQAHAASPHVEVEGRVERLAQRQVPLAGVLDRLAAGADLELDQADVGVVGVEGVGDAAQVVDLGAGGERVADHRPLDRVGAADVALLGGRGAVGVPGVGADPDRDRWRRPGRPRGGRTRG